MAYIDTSVLVAFLYPEPHFGDVEAALQKLDDRRVTLLAAAEMTSAVAIKLRRGELTPRVARAIVAKFDELIEQGVFEMRSISDDDLRQADAWLRTFKTTLRAPDAIHLAAASRAGEVLLTGDKALAKAAQTLGVAVQLVL